MPRLVVVLPLEPLGLGSAWPLATWPLHVTAAPTFVIESDLAAVVTAIEPVLRSVHPFGPTVGPDEGFGRSGAIPVSLIQPSPVLNALHRNLHAAITAIGGVFDDPQYVGENFRAHITMTKTERATPGHVLGLRQAVIVDMEPIGVQRLRRIVWTWTFG